MREIIKLNETHIDDYTSIAFNAYPSFKNFMKDSVESYKKQVVDIMQNDPIVTFYGMFEDGKMVAVMRLFDFQMNCFGKVIPVSGLGFLGVHLMHKKKKIAKEMVQFYEKHYVEREIPFGLLLPFRPDFYKNMGYGFGSKMDQYRIPTGRIPVYLGESDIRYVEGDALEGVLECHARVTSKNHGMIMKFGDEIRDLYSDDYNMVVGSYDREGDIEGYLVFKFQNAKSDNYTITNIYVKELIYENSDVLKKLLGFLRKQEDQIQLTIFNTEDEGFYYLFNDPRNDSLNYIPYGYLETNTQAVGVMYKIFDIRKAFKDCEHRNYNNANFSVKFMVSDAFTNEYENVNVKFIDGKVNLDASSYDVVVKMDIAEFSSMFLGSVSPRSLFNLGLLEMDREDILDPLDRAFYYYQKPVCYTDF